MKKTPLGIRIGRVILAIIRPFMFVLFPYRFVHQERIPRDGGPFVVCCNHISLLDPIFLYLACYRPIYFMAKGELFNIPLVGWFLETFFGVFPVARGKGDATAINTSLSTLNDGNVLGIFPEGTRSKTGKLGPLKSGASLIVAKAQVPVLPCVMFTKKNKVRLFRRTTVVFGDLLTVEDLQLDGEKPDIRFATRKLQSVFTTLLEENGI